MKDIIKNILREHSVDNTAKKYFIAAKLIADKWDDDKFEQWADMRDEDPWYRRQELEPILKLLSINDVHGEEANEIFWLAYDNRNGLRDGAFTSYADLEERPLKTYAVSVTEQESAQTEHNFDVHIDAYAKGDAFAEVVSNEDGMFHYWDWDTGPEYDREIYDSEMGERDVRSIKEIAIADNTSRKGSLGEIKEHLSASPVENDIISELEGLIENWSGCEKGLPIPCRYKNEVQSIIEKYKSKSLYEHTDNFTSHFDEPEIGEPVVNTNPGCTHYRSEGFIEDINDLPDEEGTTITYRVTNNGDTYKEGDTLTKTMDQLSPLVN